MGHRCTAGRGEVGGGKVSFHRFPHHRTQRSCGCTPRPAMYFGALPPAPMQQHPQAVGKGGELRRALERVQEEDRRVQERGAQATEEAAGATGAQARAQGTPGRGEAPESRSCSTHGRIFGGGCRGWRGQSWTASGKGNGRRGARRRRIAPRCICSGNSVSRQGAEREVQKPALKRIRGEAGNLEERDREVAEGECRLKEEEDGAARGGHRVIPKPGGGRRPHE